MMKHTYYLAVLVVAFSESFILAQSFPPPKPFTDEEQIHVVLQNLEDAIFSQNMIRLLDCFRYPLAHGDTTAGFQEVRTAFKDVFNRSSARRKLQRFQALTPPQADLTGTWDFELEIDTLNFLNDHMAQVRAWIFFGASEPEESSDWQFGKRQRDNFILTKTNGEWRIQSAGHLIRILSTYGEE